MPETSGIQLWGVGGKGAISQLTPLPPRVFARLGDTSPLLLPMTWLQPSPEALGVFYAPFPPLLEACSILAWPSWPEDRARLEACWLGPAGSVW